MQFCAIVFIICVTVQMNLAENSDGISHLFGEVENVCIDFRSSLLDDIRSLKRDLYKCSYDVKTIISEIEGLGQVQAQLDNLINRCNANTLEYHSKTKSQTAIDSDHWFGQQNTDHRVLHNIQRAGLLGAIFPIFFNIFFPIFWFQLTCKIE